jgi:hypothetical protein
LRNGRAGCGFGVVVGVGIDVLGVDETIRVGNEFDAGDVNTIGGEEGVLALFQARVERVRAIGRPPGRLEWIAILDRRLGLPFGALQARPKTASGAGHRATQRSCRETYSKLSP